MITVGMPQLTAATILQLCLLLSAVPAQYYISQWYGTDSTERLQKTEGIIRFLDSLKTSFLNLDAWTDQVKLWKLKARTWYNGDTQPQTASEDDGIEEEEDLVYFAESPKIRSPKPESVQFSVGQVVIHRRFGYSGVIIGWDVKARAPEEWLKQKYAEDTEDVKSVPHYRVLLNGATISGESTAYIPEDDIAVITGLQVHHPDLKVYFRKYDGTKYIMQPWLKQIYPHD